MVWPPAVSEPLPDDLEAGFGMNRTAEMVWSWPRRVRMHAYVEKSHSLMVRSVDEEAKCDPDGEKARAVTVLV